MKNTPTLLQYQLREKIHALKAEREVLETRIYGNMAELQQLATNPAPVLKKVLAGIADDKDLQNDLLKVGVHFTADYLIDKYLPHHKESFVSELLNNLKSKNTSKTGGVLLDIVSKLLSKKV